VAKKKYVLHFPGESVEKPVTYHLVKDYNLIPNILRAQIDESKGTLVIDLQGDKTDIEKGIEFLKDSNIGVEEAIRDIVIDPDRCVNCGSCSGVCRSGALTVDKESWLIDFNQDKCVFCELCITTCPVRAIRVKF
jgi:ferredoxin